jgi:hypothetical protein
MNYKDEEVRSFKRHQLREQRATIQQRTETFTNEENSILNKDMCSNKNFKVTIKASCGGTLFFQMVAEINRLDFLNLDKLLFSCGEYDQIVEVFEHITLIAVFTYENYWISAYGETEEKAIARLQET